MPIALNGMVIQPGDLIIGDEDGLLCVPFDDTETVLKAARAKHAAEDISLAEIRGAGARKKAWVDETLARLGCPIEP